MKVYKAELAEKIIVSGDTLEPCEKDNFQIGGKLLFDDLSVIKYMHNLNFMEKQLPKGIMKHEYIELMTKKYTDNTQNLIEGIGKKIDNGFIHTALRITPHYQDQAETDIRSITFFANGDSVVEDFYNSDYIKYDKKSTEGFYNSFNLDSNLVIRKLQKDLEIKNEIKSQKKLKL